MSQSSSGSTASISTSPERIDTMWDERLHAELAGLIGYHKVVVIAARFRADLQWCFADPYDIERLRRDAHTVTSTAGMLGFTHLSNTARRVEMACKSGAHATAPLASLLSAKEVAMDILETRFAPTEHDFGIAGRPRETTEGFGERPVDAGVLL